MFVGFVENLDSHHDKSRVMTSCDSDVVEVVKSDNELRTDKWISRRLQFTCHTVRLEAKNSCSYIVHIVSPPGNNRISVDCGARDFSLGERTLESHPGFRVTEFFTCF